MCSECTTWYSKRRSKKNQHQQGGGGEQTLVLQEDDQLLTMQLPLSLWLLNKKCTMNTHPRHEKINIYLSITQSGLKTHSLLACFLFSHCCHSRFSLCGHPWILVGSLCQLISDLYWGQDYIVPLIRSWKCQSVRKGGATNFLNQFLQYVAPLSSANLPWF